MKKNRLLAMILMVIMVCSIAVAFANDYDPEIDEQDEQLLNLTMWRGATHNATLTEHINNPFPDPLQLSNKTGIQMENEYCRSDAWLKGYGTDYTTTTFPLTWTYKYSNGIVIDYDGIWKK